MPSMSVAEACELIDVNAETSWEDMKPKLRAMQLKHHPDKGGDAEIFKKYQEAYELLRDMCEERKKAQENTAPPANKKEPAQQRPGEESRDRAKEEQKERENKEKEKERREKKEKEKERREKKEKEKDQKELEEFKKRLEKNEIENQRAAIIAAKHKEIEHLTDKWTSLYDDIMERKQARYFIRVERRNEDRALEPLIERLNITNRAIANNQGKLDIGRREYSSKLEETAALVEKIEKRGYWKKFKVFFTGTDKDKDKLLTLNKETGKLDKEIESMEVTARNMSDAKSDINKQIDAQYEKIWALHTAETVAAYHEDRLLKLRDSTGEKILKCRADIDTSMDCLTRFEPPTEPVHEPVPEPVPAHMHASKSTPPPSTNTASETKSNTDKLAIMNPVANSKQSTENAQNTTPGKS